MIPVHLLLPVLFLCLPFLSQLNLSRGFAIQSTYGCVQQAGS